jgi:predicted hotdog family 3-hydroxylacyl-ACP dehydratase
MIDIEALIPHREPIKVITEIIEVHENAGTATAVVNERWPLCDGRTVSSLVLIEAIAQTSAVVEGHKRMLAGKSGVRGWLVGIKSAEFHTERIAVNTPITVCVDSLYSFDNYGVIEGVVKSGDTVLVTAVLQAMRLNDDV